MTNQGETGTDNTCKKWDLRHALRVRLVQNGVGEYCKLEDVKWNVSLKSGTCEIPVNPTLQKKYRVSLRSSGSEIQRRREGTLRTTISECTQTAPTRDHCLTRTSYLALCHRANPSHWDLQVLAIFSFQTINTRSWRYGESFTSLKPPNHTPKVQTITKNIRSQSFDSLLYEEVQRWLRLEKISPSFFTYTLFLLVPSSSFPYTALTQNQCSKNYVPFLLHHKLYGSNWCIVSAHYYSPILTWTFNSWQLMRLFFHLFYVETG